MSATAKVIRFVCSSRSICC